jgi:proteasome assembly chaperone (PAC2) family protein
MWQITHINKTPKVKSAILIEGLPGIGNTGKIAADYIFDQTKPKEILDFYSFSLPHSAFVNQNNLVELPKIRIGYFKRKNKNFFLLYGDIQPIDEASSHSFCNEILKFCKENNIKEVIALGGIGMAQPPKTPKIYITGNNKEIIKKYSTKDTRSKIVGIVGPIIGATGLLVGLAAKYDINAVAYLAESFAHPLHVGIKEAYELLKLMNETLSLDLNLKDFQKDISRLEKEQTIKIKELSEMRSQTTQKETSYIG